MPVIGKNGSKNVFPELEKQIDFVSKVIKEEGILRTLDKGLKKN